MSNVLNRTIFYVKYINGENKIYVFALAGTTLNKNEMKKALQIEQKYLKLNNCVRSKIKGKGKLWKKL